MSGDIRLFQQADFSFDVEVEANDLGVDEGMQTAVAISLFTDARVTEDELPPEERSRRGWWGDLFPDAPGDQIGSKLWLLARQKRTVEVLRQAEEYCNEALQWMIDDGVAESVDTSASYDPPSGAMLLAISIQQPGLAQAATFRFKTKWATEAERN
jgi:phage gp46-like protein